MGHIREILEGKKVRVCGIDYTILFDNTLMAKEEKFGEVDYMGATITLDGNMNDSVTMAFLWHEVFEIVDHQAELKLKHHKIQTLGFSVNQIMTDNRGIFNYNRGE
jgi:hypothetical protein